MESSFLHDFKNFLVQLPRVESGNFIKEVDENVQQPVEAFLHKLCRKIDIKKALYVSYDEQRDLIATSSSVISNEDWLKVIYILFYWFSTATALPIKYKALNTLLKAEEIMPKVCLEDRFSNQICRKIIKEVL